MLKTERLVAYYEDRNLIVHRYRQMFMMELKGKERRTDGIEFLRNFIKESRSNLQILQGLLFEYPVGTHVA